jgi:hypothetical protein
MKQLTSHSQRTIDQINRHPTTHDLGWHAIRKMFAEVGEVEPERNGNLKLTLAGNSIVFQSPKDAKVATEDEVHDLRKFMHENEFHESSPPHMLLVIDHQAAKLYRTEFAGSVPERVIPFDPDGHKGHVHNKHSSEGQASAANHHEYFENVVKILAGNEPLLLFGSGHGSSSTSESFGAWLKERHPDVAKRIVAKVDIDQSHLTEGELLAQARALIAG